MALGIVLFFAATSALSQQLAGARQVFNGAMLPGVEVVTFEHSDTLFPVNRVPRGRAVRPLLPAAKQLQNVHFQSRGAEYDLFDYLADNRVAGLLVLKDGKVAFEDYELGAGPATRWISFSMAKSVASTLVGAAVQQGLITSLDEPLTHYLPQLKAGPYEGVSIRNIMQMASGVKWNETYTDPHSDRRKLLEKQLERKPGSIVAYMNTLSKAGPPGSIWNYSTGESFLVGALLEAATHKPLATYLSQTLWSPLGMEQDATWWVEAPGGMGLAGSGLGATLRDYGRFGLLVQQDGVIDGRRVVPAGWFQQAGSAARHRWRIRRLRLSMVACSGGGSHSSRCFPGDWNLWPAPLRQPATKAGHRGAECAPQTRLQVQPGKRPVIFRGGSKVTAIVTLPLMIADGAPNGLLDNQRDFGRHRCGILCVGA